MPGRVAIIEASIDLGADRCMELVHDSGRLLAMDMVEVNPIFDDRNHTAEFGSELILSALGKRIF